MSYLLKLLDIFTTAEECKRLLDINIKGESGWISQEELDLYYENKEFATRSLARFVANEVVREAAESNTILDLTLKAAQLWLDENHNG